MARIPYTFYRARKIVERGVVEIEVDDAADYNEIFDRLNGRDFVKCRILDQEIHFEDWKFEPQGNETLPDKMKALELDNQNT